MKNVMLGVIAALIPPTTLIGLGFLAFYCGDTIALGVGISIIMLICCAMSIGIYQGLRDQFGG